MNLSNGIAARNCKLPVQGERGINDTQRLSICCSAEWTSFFISSLEGGKPLTRDAIESLLRDGNTNLKAHLPKPENLRNSGKELWVKTILTKFQIEPKELKGKDKEITKLIPEMAALIFEKLNNNPNSESSVSLKEKNPAGSLEHLSVKAVNPKDLLAADVRDHLVRLSDPEELGNKFVAAVGLCDISEKAGNHEALLDAGVHSQLGLLLVDPQDNLAEKKCAESAAKALENLSKNLNNDQALMEADVHTQLVQLLSNPQATADAKKYAAVALMNLSAEADNHQALVNAGVHTQLVKLISDPKATAGAKEYAVVALMNLSKNEVIQPQLLAADVHAGLVGLLSDSKATAGAKEYAAKALCNLSIGAHDQMFAIVRDPKATLDEKVNVAKVLKTLSAVGDNHQALLAAGVHTQLVKRLFDDGTNPDSKKSASMALLNLMTKRPMVHSQEQSFKTEPDGTMFMVTSNWFGKRSEGIRITKKGYIYEGRFKDGKLEGKGRVTARDSTSITGKFRNGRPIGVCTRTRPNGRKTEYQATYTSADKKITKEELNRRMAAPQFVELLTGGGDGGAIRGYVLPLISTHLKYLALATSPFQKLVQYVTSTTPQMTKLASQLDFVAAIENEEASISIEKIKARLATPDKEVVISYGRDKHAMLLKLKFTDKGLNVEIYNSGEGLPEHHDHHPQSGVNKYNTCKEKLYPNMRPNSPEFNTLLTNILKYQTFKDIDQSYAVFAGAQDVVSVAPNWQRHQKAGNCSLECVMAFLKKNMSPADYLQYRMTLISDVKTQAEAHKGSYEETLDPKVSNRLDAMLENRKVKQSGAVEKRNN